MKVIFLISMIAMLINNHQDLLYQTRFAEKDPNCVKLDEPQETGEPEIDFLEFAPKIDGILDKSLKNLAPRKFNYVRFHAKDKSYPVVPLTYRLAYGTTFFYSFIEVKHDQMFFNDRAFQNGDGFQLLMACPRKNNQPTDEYYVIACSAVNQKNLEWTRRIIWVNNLTNIFVPLSDDTKMEFHFTGEKSSFELFLPWKDVPPFHPWLMKNIGFNLKFVKAFRDQPTAYYYVFPDKDMAQENKKPLYCYLKFAKPKVNQGSQYFIRLSRNHMFEQEKLSVHCAILTSDQSELDLDFRVYDQGGNLKLDTSEFFKAQPGINILDVNLQEISLLPTNHYKIQWKSSLKLGHGEDDLTIFSKFDAARLKSQLNQARNHISRGSYATLYYHINKYEHFLESLRPYESAPNTRNRISRLIHTIDQASKGNDTIIKTTGFYRRAFQSKIDNSYQPYCIRIPGNFSRSNKYPLIVFLHGSASTETDMFGFSFINNGQCIELGPFARGRSNFYCTDHAQEDIAEAIHDVIINYPIDTKKIILTGFSMGGYGVLRTFTQTPNKFRALAIFSGRPYVNPNTKKCPNLIYPNFLDKEKLSIFKDMPVFIFHGKKDKNCPHEKIKELVKYLKEAGARVSFYTEDNLGHQKMSSKSIPRYHQWLEKILNR